MNNVNSMEEKIRSPLVPSKLPIAAESKEGEQDSAPSYLVLEDKISIIKDEIASEAAQITSQEIGKQQTSATACEVIKKELVDKAGQIYNKPQDADKSESEVPIQAKKALEEANWFEQ